MQKPLGYIYDSQRRLIREYAQCMCRLSASMLHHSGLVVPGNPACCCLLARAGTRGCTQDEDVDHNPARLLITSMSWRDDVTSVMQSKVPTNTSHGQCGSSLTLTRSLSIKADMHSLDVFKYTRFHIATIVYCSTQHAQTDNCDYSYKHVIRYHMKGRLNCLMGEVTPLAQPQQTNDLFLLHHLCR